jgi:predicted NBD/HSP70 family sugar kinase
MIAVENGTVRQDDVAMKSSVKAVLAVDVGGSSVKILATGQSERRSFSSGPTLTPRRMVSGVKKLAGDWMYDAVSIGYPGPVLRGRPISEPYNLGSWRRPVPISGSPSPAVGGLAAFFSHPVLIALAIARCVQSGVADLLIRSFCAALPRRP